MKQGCYSVDAASKSRNICFVTAKQGFFTMSYKKKWFKDLIYIVLIISDSSYINLRQAIIIWNIRHPNRRRNDIKQMDSVRAALKLSAATL